MAYLIAPTEELGYPGFQLGTPGIPHSIFPLTEKVTLPSGALRIGGDSPDGLVLVGTAPAARVVRLFDRATGVLVAETTSGGDGTYSFTALSARTDGYDVVIRGVIASGERDVIVPGVQPG